MIRANWKWTNDIEAEILRELQGVRGRIVHVCSATSGIGDIRIDRWASKAYEGDRRIFGLPNVIADMQYLPIRSGSCGAVVADPPYDMKRHGKALPLLFREMERITAPAGKIIVLAPIIPQMRTAAPRTLWMRPAGIDKGAFPSYKILSVSIKVNGQITDYDQPQAQTLPDMREGTYPVSDEVLRCCMRCRCGCSKTDGMDAGAHRSAAKALVQDII